LNPPGTSSRLYYVWPVV